MIELKGDLPPEEGEHRWRDKYGDTWTWNATIGSWQAESKKALKSMIFTKVPARYGPFERVE